MGVRGRKNRDTSRGSSRKDIIKVKDEKKAEKRPKKDYKTFVDRKKKTSNQKIRFAPKSVSKNDDGKIRLNKYLSNAGICSRREADEMIKLGIVTVNGEMIQEVGTKVTMMDVVRYDGSIICPEKMRYVLLNKPKNILNATTDPKGRKTVMSLIENASKEQLYPIGKMDKVTTGLLLFTNDGDLAKKLTHPKNQIEKLYHVFLGEKVNPKHLDMMREGIELDDGFIKAGEVSFGKGGTDRYSVGIEIHTGRNRIVRRMFEYFGYTVTKMDRVKFAGLSKKDVPRGQYRHLDDKEIGFLKML